MMTQCRRFFLCALAAAYGVLLVVTIQNPPAHAPFMQVLKNQRPFVTVKFQGRLGNQLFQAAAAISLALDNNCDLLLPKKMLQWQKEDVGTTMQKILWRLPRSKISKRKLSQTYNQPVFSKYEPIPFHPNMRLSGYFESEKHFKHHKEVIVNLFSPSLEITRYLYSHYKQIIEHPKSVAIHVRTFYRDYLKDGPHFYEAFPAPDLTYFEKALAFFGDDALFVVFSDHIDWCKKTFARFSKNFVFIENEAYYHDFYLISLCKHVITSNSTFSWWAAYLNPNPGKIILARTPWFYCKERPSEDIIPADWICIEGDPHPPIPSFD